MISKSPHGKETIVGFQLNSGRPTSVVGDFNHWDPLATPMHPTGEGAYELNLLLGPGRYAFRYLAEGGEWFDDESCDSIESDGRGGSHGILIVP